MCSFWELVLKLYSTEVLYPISKDNYCFEFRDDILTNIVPHYHGERLMKDEYIDGRVTFCLRTKARFRVMFVALSLITSYSATKRTVVSHF